MSYNLDTKAAREGDSQASRITDTGAYEGTFTRAEKVLSEKGTQGIEFSFQSKDKATADFLTLWTISKDGEQIYGFKQLMALMTCLKVKTIDEKQGQVDKYDPATRQRGKVNATIYPDLMNKSIGILLQKEDYAKRDGSIGHKFNLYGFYDPATRMTAVEILDKATKATKLDSMIATLRDKPMQGAKPSASSGAPAMAGGIGAFEDDSIPFAPRHWKEG